MSRLTQLFLCTAAVAAVAVPAAGGAAPSKVALSCSTSTPVTLAGHTLDLTGKWTTSSGDYYLRQLGNCIFWSGQSKPTGTWANVFLGQLTGAVLKGYWSDVPSATIRQNGTLKLRVNATGTKLTAVLQTGGFGDTSWTKSP